MSFRGGGAVWMIKWALRISNLIALAGAACREADRRTQRQENNNLAKLLRPPELRITAQSLQLKRLRGFN
jgi:hypothetical protein